jgi:WD40 repeat protein
MKRLFLIFSFLASVNLLGMDGAGAVAEEVAEDLSQRREGSLQAIANTKIVNNLADYNIESLLSLPNHHQDYILDQWANNPANLSKLMAVGAQLWVKQELKSVGISVVSVAARENLIVAGTNDGMVNIWNRVDGQWERQELDVGSVRSVAVAENLIVVISMNGMVNIWNRVDDLWVAQALDVGPAISVAATENLIVAGSRNGMVNIWNRQEDGLWAGQELENVGNGLTSVAATENLIVVGTESSSRFMDGGEVNIWNRVEGQWVRERLYVGFHSIVSVAATENLIVAGTGNGMVNIWNRVDGQRVAPVSENAVSSIVSVAATENLIVAGSRSGMVNILNRQEDGQWVRQKLENAGNWLALVAATENLIAVGFRNGMVNVWNKQDWNFLTLPIIYAIEKQELSGEEKELLNRAIDWSNLPSQVEDYLIKKLGIGPNFPGEMAIYLRAKGLMK